MDASLLACRNNGLGCAGDKKFIFARGRNLGAGYSLLRRIGVAIAMRLRRVGRIRHRRSEVARPEMVVFENAGSAGKAGPAVARGLT